MIGATDRQLVLNETARLPIINVEVSINGFFILAPLLAMGIFVYFQLYLQRIKGLIRDLRANYAPVEKRRLYPWMLNIAEDPEPGLIGKMQNFVVQLSLWWSLPVVLLLFVIIPFAKHFKAFCVDLSHQVLVEEPSKDYKNQYWLRLNDAHLEGADFRNSVLKRADLRGAKLQNADFRLADLDETDFTNANLKGADLRQASLNSTIFKASNLQNADLQGSKISHTHFQNANLNEAGFQGTQLDTANFIGADLRNADFKNARLIACSVHDADLRRTDFTDARVFIYGASKAKLNNTIFRGAMMPHLSFLETKLNRTDFEQATMSFASFGNSILDSVNFNGAALSQANFKGAEFSIHTTLHGADLRFADLRGTNLTVSQLPQVQTLYRAKLDSSLLDQIQEKFPGSMSNSVGKPGALR